MRDTSGRTRRCGSLHEIKEINVMPLVDLLLQMFIAVVIFFPVVEYGMNINLPATLYGFPTGGLIVCHGVSCS